MIISLRVPIGWGARISRRFQGRNASRWIHPLSTGHAALYVCARPYATPSAPHVRSNVVECAHRAPPGVYLNTKRIIVCCDGTWNNTNKRGGGPPSNVSRLSGAIARKCCTGKPQIIHYHPGVGTEETKASHYIGGAFGVGVLQDIVESYRFICDNYNPGDELVILGFSRGAFTARSVASMVCNLGFLNRAGLDALPHIFHDYHHWTDWTSEAAYNEEEYLCGFSLENYARVARLAAWRRGGKLTKDMAELKKDLEREKKAFFGKMARQVVGSSGPGKTQMDLGKMAGRYREMLSKHGMCQTRRVQNSGSIKYAPIEGKVKAVGVWDTVGSLGLPRMQWGLSNVTRNDRELRFASLGVHPNVDHAFHALALDEWRTAFGPTLWNREPDNKHTELRQVWFPGSHSNVGGGFEDQQIATIALAWMADQLTSVGVEFSKPEMQRIFYDVNPTAQVRPWAMGKIHNPSGITAIPDRVFDSLPWRYLAGVQTPARKPGLYTGDEDSDLLPGTMESVHPSVRMRYLYDGKGLDDEPHWPCRALTENGYTLVQEDVSRVTVRPPRVPEVLEPYYTAAGVLVPFFDNVQTVKSEATSSGPITLVRTEQPHERDLQDIPEPTAHWVWKRGNKVLPEEQIGMWERMYMKTNEKLVIWQGIAEERRRRKLAAEEAKTKSCVSPLMRIILDAWSAAGKPLGTSWESYSGAGKEKEKPEGFVQEYGYHDLVVWQRADTTPNHAPGMGIARGMNSIGDGGSVNGPQLRKATA